MAEELFLHRRIADELAAHPPFSELGREPLLVLAEHAEVTYVAPGEWLFAAGDALHERIYFVQKGTLTLWRDGERVDHVERGELLGLRTLFQTGTYQAGARPLNDALVYGLPLDLAKQCLVHNPDTEHFFQLDWKGDREDFVPSGTSLRRLMKARSSHLILPVTDSNLRLEPAPALTASPGALITEVAAAMTAAGSDAAVLVDAQGHPQGILTDKDLRTFLGRPGFRMDARAADVMNAPVKTFPPALTYAGAMVGMVEGRIHHLVITEDGTDASPVVGILSDHDLLLEQALNPTIIAKHIAGANDRNALLRAGNKVEQLRLNYIEANVSTSYLLKVLTQFYSGLYAGALRLAELELGPAPCRWAWIVLGSLGRGEQLLRTDQDHALVLESGGHDAYFAAFAGHVSGTMEVLGFEEDQFGVSATQPLWRGTPEEWADRLAGWMREGAGDALLRLSIVLDARVVAGEKDLALRPFQAFYGNLTAAAPLLHTFAQDALRNPSPLGMFKQLKLDRSGQFDLKLRAILPFIDAAKVLASSAGKAHVSSTVGRLEAVKDGSNDELMNSAIHAYEILLEMRSKFASDANEHGRYIDPEALDQLDKQLLRNVLKTLEALQAHLKLRFKL